MVFLKDDGSLDIERINRLPIEERMDMLGKLTDKQWDYYRSTLPVEDSSNCPRNIIVDYTMEEEIARGTGVDISKYLMDWKSELK